MFRIAIDVGGTFTDLVAVDEEGREALAKTPSTPANQAQGVMAGIDKLAGALGLDAAALLARTERIVHGMTVATNALLERRGARVGLLTSAGHRDILEMREGLKPERYNLRLARPDPLVPRARRLGVVERLRFDGTVEIGLDMESVDIALEALQRAQVESVAICLLHAYRNSAHEQRIAERVRERMPGTYVSQSSQVLPQIKEYQRVATTVINAYVGPLIERYLADLNTRLEQAGYAGPLLVMLSHGGVAPVEEAIRIAAGTVLSGPAGGVAGARRVAEMSGIKDLIPLDMGGTSTDISLIVDGAAALASDRQLANETIALKSLDIVTLGAGGGSIAAHGGGALVSVGPHSAGADPGPASYGRGGTQATVTDASVILGYLTPQRFMGGSTALDTAAAERAVGTLAKAVQLDTLSMAAGIHRIVNTQMAEGIRLATVRRGVDPRNFTLLGFGGAAGLHVSALARMLNLRRVLVPNMASVMSAWGMLASELRFEVSRSHVGDTGSLDLQSVEGLYQDLEAQACARMRAWFDGPITATRSADMRYGEQVFEIDVPLDGIELDGADGESQLKRAFEARHEALFTYALPEQSPVLVNAHVAAIGALGNAVQAVPPRAHTHGQSARNGTRNVYLESWQEVPVYAFDALHEGESLAGPAMVESDSTSVLLQAADTATVTAQGWLDISIPGER
jgi:N-methylhydantoinase A